MRKITLLLILVSIFIQAQKIKVKKGEIFLDKNKVGFIKKVKVKGAKNYLKVLNNDRKHLFNAKFTYDESIFLVNKNEITIILLNVLNKKILLESRNLVFI